MLTRSKRRPEGQQLFVIRLRPNRHGQDLHNGHIIDNKALGPGPNLPLPEPHNQPPAHPQIRHLMVRLPLLHADIHVGHLRPPKPHRQKTPNSLGHRIWLDLCIGFGNSTNQQLQAVD